MSGGKDHLSAVLQFAAHLAPGKAGAASDNDAVVTHVTLKRQAERGRVTEKSSFHFTSRVLVR